MKYSMPLGLLSLLCAIVACLQANYNLLALTISLLACLGIFCPIDVIFKDLNKKPVSFRENHKLLCRFYLDNQKSLWLLYNQLPKHPTTEKQHFLIVWTKDSGPLMYWDHRIYSDAAFIIIKPNKSEKEFRDQIFHYYLTHDK